MYRQLAGAEGAERRLGDGRRGAMAGTGEGVAQGADYEATHDSRVAEADFGLGRVDVDVDLALRADEKQHDHRMTVAREEILIGAAHRTDQQLVAHRAAVDEKILIARCRPVERRQPGEADQAEALALRVDCQRIIGEFAAENRGQTLTPCRRALVSGIVGDQICGHGG